MSEQVDGQRAPSTRARSVAAASRASPEARRRLWGAVLAFHGSLLVPAGLLVAVGHVHPSRDALRDLFPLWILIGVGLFCWHMLRTVRVVEMRDSVPTARRTAGLALLAILLSTFSTVLLALALPAIPHRWVSGPVEVRTFVTDKVVTHGKSTSYCLSTPEFDPRIAPIEWCTDRGSFDRAHVGQEIVLHGTSSWFGFQQDGFVLVDAPGPSH